MWQTHGSHDACSCCVSFNIICFCSASSAGAESAIETLLHAQGALPSHEHCRWCSPSTMVPVGAVGVGAEPLREPELVLSAAEATMMEQHRISREDMVSKASCGPGESQISCQARL